MVTRGWGPKAVLQQQGLDWIALKLFPWGGVVRSSVGHPVETLNCWARAGSQPGSHIKLKLQYFGHLMQRADSLEKILMLGKIEGRRLHHEKFWAG